MSVTARVSYVTETSKRFLWSQAGHSSKSEDRRYVGISLQMKPQTRLNERDSLRSKFLHFPLATRDTTIIGQ